ncbi:MAG: DUF3795 domain-containing protein [Candidatus Wallbacteria bacterium]|nr:DUF3795 domain-containing protein [Candidatus Wallbacteria bacterium]
MAEIKKDPTLIAACGLYCGACGSYLKGRCMGCRLNEKAFWCKVRTCCIKLNYKSCANCRKFLDPEQCGLFSNFFSKLIAMFTGSSRSSCIKRIREVGAEKYAEEMASSGRMSLPKQKK